MSGVLRWVQDLLGTEWHLAFGHEKPLCGETLRDIHRTRYLSEGAPADRCQKCATVIRFRLGLWRPE